MIGNLGERGDQVAEKLRGAGDDITRSLSATGEQITAALTRSGDVAAERMSAGAERMIAAVTDTNQKMSDDFESVVERMVAANDALNDILASASNNLISVEEGLAARASEFRMAIDGAVNETDRTSSLISRQVDALRQISEVVLKDVTELASRFDEQGKVLQVAAGAIDHSNERMNDALRERHAALAELSRSIAGKVEDVDALMGNVGEMVAGSLSNAERLASEIGAILAERAAETARAIESEYQRLQGSADDQTQRTSEAMREHYAQVQDEIQRMLTSSRAQFEDMTRQVRNASQEVARELEATRAELSRGVLDMPEEARESTTAVRRMVTEQIKALDELSAIISRHGRSLELSSAEPAAARRRPDTWRCSGRGAPRARRSGAARHLRR